MKISQVKTNLQAILTNLSQLQTYRDSLTQDNFVTESEKIAKCKSNIEKSFNSLETEKVDKVVVKLKQRKAKRLRRTKKLKALKVAAKSSKNITRSDWSDCTEDTEQQPTRSLLKRKSKDANEYLAFMDCLQTLHKLRNGDAECKLDESLASIRSIWMPIAETTKKQLENPPSSATQWRQAPLAVHPNLQGSVELKSLSDDAVGGIHI